MLFAFGIDENRGFGQTTCRRQWMDLNIDLNITYIGKMKLAVF